jgi:hypothetical protein
MIAMPEKLDVSKLMLQVRDPSAREWVDVFARVGA